MWYGFNLTVKPEETRVKAGDTVTIEMSVTDINVGETGLNNVIGFLEYDEQLFETVNIKSFENWNIELNQIKGHNLYGKFCIYTMQEGVVEEQNITRNKYEVKK